MPGLDGFDMLRFTLFNSITFFILLLTLLVVWRRFAGRPSSNWPLAYYTVLAAYTWAFSGGLNPFWVAAGVVCALAIRFGLQARYVRLLELLPLAYVIWRCIGLILMW